MGPEAVTAGPRIPGGGKGYCTRSQARPVCVNQDQNKLCSTIGKNFRFSGPLDAVTIPDETQVETTR